MNKIPKFKLIAKPLTDEAKELQSFHWAPPPIGSRHFLGGEPEKTDGFDWPSCKECDQKMTFYAQLDSLNDEFCIADCGLLYVFICFDCILSVIKIHSE